MGLGYRWPLDFAGWFIATPRGAKYVLVMVEHFRKWIELVALSQYFAELAANRLFRSYVGTFWNTG
jgi:hypothetical protein